MQERLSQDQIALVLRRAAELDRELGGVCETPGLDEAAVEQAALEAGVSRPAIRQALAELRAGILTAPPVRPRAILGSPTLTICRSVPGPADAVEHQIHRFLHDQLFELRRDYGSRTTWVRRRGLEAVARRAIDRAVQRRVVLVDVEHVDVSVLDHGDERVLVRLDVDMRTARQAQGGILGSAAVVGSGLAVSMGTVGLTEHPAFLLLAAGGVGLVGAGHWAGTRYYRQRVAELESALGGMLDRLERGQRLTRHRGRRHAI